MKVIQTQAQIGEDRMLHLRLPDDAPTGEVEVIIVVDAARPLSRKQRLAAFEASLGAFAHVDFSRDDYAAERRAEEARLNRALGL